VTGPVRQLAALLALRWHMLRGAGGKLATVLVGLLVLWLVRVLLGSGALLDPVVLATAVELAPAAFLGFGVLALVAPLTAGGGHQVVPPDQLAAYPLRASTQFLGGLLLAPVNLVWLLQLLALVALTGYLTLDGSTARGGLTTLAWVACVTVVGQALAWLVVGARQTGTGRRAVGVLGAAVAVAVVAVVQSGSVGTVVDRGPTEAVVRAVVAGGDGATGRWLPTTAALLAATAVALAGGAAACAWALRRPGDARALRHTAPVRRRDARPSVLRELVAVDRASVWRAPALRRGGLVLVLLPGLLAAAVRVPWESLIVLPGLVAAGAGLLFGVNAFALDASGSLWLASLPVAPRLLLLSKLVVLGETVLLAVVVAAVAGALRAPDDPTPAQLAAVLSAGLACAAVVVALCLASSVRRPHRADLRGPRDAVAPPGALALASARLAVPCALVGTVIASSSHAGVAWLPLALAVPVVLLAVLSVLRSARRWEDPFRRARVVQVVASG
jgi:hypothetical protein